MNVRRAIDMNFDLGAVESRFRAPVVVVLARLIKEFGFNDFGLLLGGSVAMGAAQQHSDLDLFVGTNRTWRSRSLDKVDGIMVDLSIEPFHRLTALVSPNGSAVFIQNFSYGLCLKDSNGNINQLISIAKNSLHDGRRLPNKGQLFEITLRARKLYETISQPNARGDTTVFLTKSVLFAHLVDSCVWLQGRWSAGHKRDIETIEAIAPEVGLELKGMTASTGWQESSRRAITRIFGENTLTASQLLGPRATSPPK